METIFFSTKQFHLWPFYNGFNWMGFLPTHTISVGDNEISFLINGKDVERFSPQEVEGAHFFKTWFGWGKTKVGFSTKKNKSEKEKRGDCWYFLSNDYSYVSSSNQNNLIQSFKEIHTKCFDEKGLSLRNGKLWMCNEYVVEYGGNNEIAYWALEIPELKYFYSEKSMIPWKKPVLVTGSDHPLRIKKLSTNDVAKLKQHVIGNGAKLGEISNATFHHAFSFGVIFHPSQWFTSCSIGLGDEGVSFSQKTFKTNDNLFLPYDKINFALSTGSWYNLTRKLYIYGEQNIIPKRRFSSGDAKRIINELREKGIGQFEGKELTESYHSSWVGVLLCIVTLGIWHLIVMMFSKKRKSIIIGEEVFAWNGDLWQMDPDNYRREKTKEGLKFFVGKADDIKDIYYYKKHWYHLWGYVFIWVHPSNIRSLAYEADQMSQDYDLEMGKVYSSTAKEIVQYLKEKGFRQDSERHSLYKKWIKHFIKAK